MRSPRKIDVSRPSELSGAPCTLRYGPCLLSPTLNSLAPPLLLPLGGPLEEVRATCPRSGLAADQGLFLVGCFAGTLPSAPIGRLGILRLDGDMYESAMDALRYLYPKLSVGGYAIIGDYGVISACKAAVEDFRAEQGVKEELQWIDRAGVFWRRL